MEKHNSPIPKHQSEPKRKRNASTVSPSASPFPNGKEDYSVKHNGSDEELCVKLSHQTVLDCPICFHPLTIPVFQCPNGHIACSPCHYKLKPKICPSCSNNLGCNIRNRAIESVLESIKAPCSYKRYGCAAEFPYSTKASHEETCTYAPYACPFGGCKILGSQRNLYLHLKRQHSTTVVAFSTSASIFYNFSVRKVDEFVVFLEEGGDGAIIILDLTRMRISRLPEPNLSTGKYIHYYLNVQHECGTFRFKPHTYTWPNASAAKEKAAGTDDASKDLLRILDSFYGRDGRIKLQIYIMC